MKSHRDALEAQIEHLLVENDRIQAECTDLSIKQGVQREALDEANTTVSELGVHIGWLQTLLDGGKVEAKQLQGEVDKIRDDIDAKVEEHNLSRAQWEQERAALKAHIASLEGKPTQQPPADWELEKKGLVDKLAEVTEERDELDKAKRYAENEAETWKEEYRKGFMDSQERRQEAKDANAEASRVREESAIVASQTKESVRLITAKYETIVAKLRTELARAESVYKVLQAKDEQTGDDVRRRAASATQLQEEVRRLYGELESADEAARKAARVTELEHGKLSFLPNSFSAQASTEAEYICQASAVDGVKCGRRFGSPQVLQCSS